MFQTNLLNLVLQLNPQIGEGDATQLRPARGRFERQLHLRHEGLLVILLY